MEKADLVKLWCTLPEATPTASPSKRKIILLMVPDLLDPTHGKPLWIWQSMIVRTTEYSKAIVSYHLNQLEAEGKIQRMTTGGRNYWRVNHTTEKTAL